MWCSSSVAPPFHHMLWLFLCIIGGSPASAMICDDSAHLEKDSKFLASNSVVGVGTTTFCVVPHCANHLYSVMWYKRDGKTPIPFGDGNVIHVTMGSDLEIGPYADYIYNGTKGIYTCKISNVTTNETLYTLHVGFYTGVTQETAPTISTPIFNVIQNYPLSIEIIVTTTKYPPTNINWFKDGILLDSNITDLCGVGHHHVLKNGKEAEYELVLYMKEQPMCVYSGGYEVTVNTNGGIDVVESINITQVLPPSNVTLISLSATGITVSWTPPAPSALLDSNGAIIIDQYCAIVEGNESCTVTNSTYQLVIPVTVGIASFSVHLLSVGSSNAIPSQPETVRVSLELLSSIELTLVNVSTLQVTWKNHPPSNDHHYLIPVDKISINITSNCSFLNHTFEQNIANKMATQGTVVVGKLHPSMGYCVSVIVSNPWASSGQVTECVETSSGTTTAPSAAPMIMNITNTQQYCSPVRISWFPIPCQSWNGPLSHYTLCFNELPLTLTINNQSNSTACDIIHHEYGNHGYCSELEKGLLKYYMQYRVQIARVNIGNFTGSFSNDTINTDFNTTECFPEAPKDLKIVSKSLKTITINWSPKFTTNGLLQNYIVRYNMPGHTSSVEIAPLKLAPSLLNHSSYTVTELYPNTSYTLTIAAVNGAGEGDMASETAKTNPIGQVSNLTVVSLTNSVRVQWIKLSLNEISGYKLSYTNDTSGRMVEVTHRPSSANGRSPFTSYVLSMPNNTEYTVSVAGLVVVNDSMEVIGPWANISGCHGNCEQEYIIHLYIAIGGGAVLGLIVYLITCCICIVICIKCGRYKLQGYRRHQPLMIEMQKGGKAPSLISKPADLYVTEGDDITLLAPVTGQPFPLITWFYNDDIIADDDHFELDEDNDSQLQLLNIMLSHAGVYRFTATSTLGSVEGIVRVFVEPGKQKSKNSFTETTDGNVRDNGGGNLQGNNYIIVNERFEESEGDNVRCKVETDPVPLIRLADYIEKMNRKHKREFKRQFGNLQCFESILSCKVGDSAEHKRRNRFENIIPFDNNRIILQQIEGRGDCTQTYINASYIDGFSQSRQFIATQGPLPQTLVDFWRLIWQENVTCIVLLLKDLMEGGLVRCQQYWPDSGTSFYGPYKVTLSSNRQYNTYIKRTMILAPVGSSNNSHLPRTIHHIQFTDWPDHGLPSSVSSLVSFVGNLEEGEWLEQRGTPILVHCSAGIGRTGVLLSLINGIEMGRQTGHVDILGIVNTLRKQRMKMVQTEEQYAFIHYAVLEGLYCKGSGVDPINLRPRMRKMVTPRNELGLNSYEAEFKAVTVLSPNPDEVSRNKGIENPRLSRSKLFLPPDDHRVVLQKKDNDFIHASFLSGYNQDKGFIIAESPTLNTVQLFWEMIVEQKCAVIVMLCDCAELERDTCYPYWPASLNSVKEIGDYKIKNIEEHIDQNYTELRLQVTDKEEMNTNPDHDTVSAQQGQMCDIHQIQVPQWSPTGESSDHQSIIAAVTRVEVIQRQTGNRPILVHCSDTVTRSGVFCTLYKAIQQCKAEQVVDIYQTLKTLRVQKPGLIPNVFMYKMVYELLARYLESEFEIYRNFSKSTECIAT